MRLRPCDDNTREKREHQLLPSAVVFCAQYHSKNMTFDITSPDEPLGATSLLRAEIVKDFSCSWAARRARARALAVLHLRGEAAKGELAAEHRTKGEEKMGCDNEKWGSKACPAPSEAACPEKNHIPSDITRRRPRGDTHRSCPPRHLNPSSTATLVFLAMRLYCSRAGWPSARFSDRKMGAHR